jgi:hypothetical protein
VLGNVSAALVLAALVVLGVAAGRRRRPDVAAAGAIGLALCAAIAFVAASTPKTGLLWITLGYTLWWASPAGLWVYLTLGWGAAALTGRVAPERWLAPAFAVLAAATVYSAATQRSEQLRPLYAPTRALAARVPAALPHGSYVRVELEPPTLLGAYLQSGLIYAMRRDGLRVSADSYLVDGLGGAYRHGPPYDRVVRIHDGAPAGAGERVIARVLVAARVRVDTRKGLEGRIVRFPVITRDLAGAGPRVITVGVSG